MSSCFRRIWIAALAAFTVCCLAAAPAFAQKRLAFVVGVQDYANIEKLGTPLSDVDTLAGTLRKLSFDITVAKDVDRVSFFTAFEAFKRKIATGDTVMFFFAGHGVGLSGANYLLPRDIPAIDLDGEQLLRNLSIAESDVIEGIRERGARLTLVVLDSCRNNPIETAARQQAAASGRSFKRSTRMMSRGLAASERVSGVLSIYSAGIGQEALDVLGPDDTSRNSVFMRVFATKLLQPGLSLGDLVSVVQEEVSQLALTAKHVDGKPRPHVQTPASYNETRGGLIYLAGRPVAPSPVAPSPVVTSPVVTAPAASSPAPSSSDEVQRLQTRLKQLEEQLKSRDAPAKPKEEAKVAAIGPAPVRQRVVLYEEVPNDSAGRRFEGSVAWRTEMVSSGPDKVSELAVRADIEIPERKLNMSFTVRRNNDRSLPASHTIEMMFNLPPDFPGGGISNVPGVLAKQGEQTRGTPLAGLAVKVADKFFLIGLSAVESDQARNIQQLKERAWLDIPVVYNNKSRAIIAIEKGTPGQRAFADSFAAWKQ